MTIISPERSYAVFTLVLGSTNTYVYFHGRFFSQGPLLLIYITVPLLTWGGPKTRIKTFNLKTHAIFDFLK